jgi:putative phosphoribosyl transferase
MKANTAYRDRRHAGQVLAQRLGDFKDRGADVIVLALPRGGVPVAFEVARALHASLDVFIVRKLGVPGREEYAMGAIASGGVCVLNHEVVDWLGISQAAIDTVMQAERLELARREHLYRQTTPVPSLHARTVLLIDDGLATGSTMRAAIRACRQQQPRLLVAAIPVADADVCESLRNEADEVVCASTPEPFQAVGRWYEDFTQTSDDEVRALLAAAR